MFAAIPYYNLPALRKAIENDLPAAPKGLIATWKQISHTLKLQKQDSAYCYPLEMPVTAGELLP